MKQSLSMKCKLLKRRNKIKKFVHHWAFSSPLNIYFLIMN